MTTLTVERADTGQRPAVTAPRSRRLPEPVTGFDLMVLLTMIAAAFIVTSALWWNPGNELRQNPQDEAFLEWMLGHGARVATEWINPFFSDLQNYPDGVNMMANTSMLAISVPMTPLTLAFGPHTAFTVFLTAALAATGVAWYVVLSRGFRVARWAAAVGAGFCAFAPSAISHAQGHPNIVAQFLVPFLILQTLRLQTAGHAVRHGSVLALLVVWQAFINLEVLFMTAIGLGLFTTTIAMIRRDMRRAAVPFLRGLGVTALIAVTVLAYPLYLHFWGSQSYDGLPPHIRAMGTDLAAFVGFARQSIGGDEAVAVTLAQNAAEENTFFGWGLLIFVVAAVVWLRRRAEVVALAVVAGVFALLALGPQITVNGRATGIPSFWSALQALPVLDSVVPTRWGMGITPVIGIVLALTCQQIHRLVTAHPQHVRGPATLATTTLLSMGLLPLTPTPLPAQPKTPTPDFVASGAWRTFLGDDRALVTLPLPDHRYPEPLRWSAETGQRLRIARGYFLGPDGAAGVPGAGNAAFSAPPRPTDILFSRLRDGAPVPPISTELRSAVVRDLRYWRAGAIVVAPQPNDTALRTAMTRILGRRAIWTGGVWLWDVREIAAIPRQQTRATR